MRTRLLTAAAVALSCVLVRSSWGATESVIYTFTGGSDGAYPETTLVKSGGYLYGTASQGGAYGFGTVFRLQHGTSGWTETVLYSFTGGADGVMPSGPIAVDQKGNVYGATGNGGSNYKGNVYEVSPAGGGTWTETTLYSFTGASDGAYPFGGVTLDKAGNLYGTAYEGGSMSDCDGAGCGVVFELTPGSGGWTEAVLHAFSETDGALPESPLVMDAAGNLYGATTAGGTSNYCVGSPANGCGVVFKLTVSNGQWSESVLHDFNVQGSDGVDPYAVTLRGGNLYGVTFGGGTAQDGTSFELIGAKTWKEQILHSFSGGKDGAFPVAGVVFDKAGNLYGTTRNGGKGQCYGGCGVVYELKLSAQKWTEKVVYRFTGGNDGAEPVTSLTVGATGSFYGAASQGGADGKGVAFELP